MVKNSMAISLAVVCAILLYIADTSKIKWQSYLALAIIAVVSFSFPLFANMVMVPVTVIVFINSYQKIGKYWSMVKDIKIQ